MTVSIANMSQVWMANSNVYNAISMSVSTLGYGANASSKLLNLSVDGNSKFSVDATGRILSSYSKPIFSGMRLVTPAWENYTSNSTWIANSAFLNNGNYYNTSTGLFTCPVAGFYRISAGILCGQPNTWGYMTYYKSGVYSSALAHFNANATSAWATISYSVVVQAVINDTLGVGVYTNGGASFYNNTYNYVTIEFVG
jgi:hypothetical protein